MHANSSGRGTQPRFFAIINYVMFAVFLLCVAVQVNDPDSIRWMGIYGLSAAFCLLGARGRLHWSMASLVAVLSMVWAIIVAGRADGVSWADMTSAFSMKTLQVEEAREAGGLLIVAVWMIVLAIAAAIRSRGTGSRSSATS